MKASFAKSIYNKLPEGVKRLSGSAIRKKLIENEHFKTQFKELVQAESKSAEELKEMQLELLRRTCIHAYEHTAYYKKIFDQVGFDPYSQFTFDEFSNKVPTISKQQVLDNYEAVNCNDITDDYPATTGGSSGTRLQVNNAWETFYRENAFHYHFMSLHGYDYKHDKTLLLAGEESEQLCSTSPLYNMIRVSGRYLNEKNFAQALAFVNKAKPDIIIAIPSSAYQFCKYLRMLNVTLQKPVKAVFFRSENVNPTQRAYIEETLGCESFAYYGSTERIAFGEEQKVAGGGCRFMRSIRCMVIPSWIKRMEFHWLRQASLTPKCHLFAIRRTIFLPNKIMGFTRLRGIELYQLSVAMARIFRLSSSVIWMQHLTILRSISWSNLSRVS